MIVEPVLPPRPTSDVRPRSAVTLWPLLTYLLIFDWLFGFVVWIVLFLIFNLTGLPAAVQALSLVAGAAVWIGSWLRTSIRFTADDLVVISMLRPRSVPWSRVAGVSLSDMADDDTGRVTGRRLSVRYRRDAEPPAEPMPTVSGEWRAWDRRHFRTMSLPVLFPPSLDEIDYIPSEPRTWIGRRGNRQREIIRAEFAARGYSLPD
jgi:hypothetical protein